MLNFDKPVNTRIAPSPTGNAHIGLVRTAYLNYLAARASGGRFYVRIDDTDSTRSESKFADDILATFDWLGLDNDGVFYQSNRYDSYGYAAESLLDIGAGAMRDGALYLNVSSFFDKYSDLIAGDIPINKNNIDAIKNLVLMRSDGTPTYHFASCVDDISMNINLIIRGTDHLDNTAKHIHIINAINLGYSLDPKPILFAHVGLIFHNGKKISKRDGLADMAYYRDKYSADSVLNAVLKLGWSHPDANIDKHTPLIDKDVALRIFADGHLKSAKSTLDLNKLDWLEKKYAKR
jgi:glutamyl-tRNA synthetase